MMDTTELMQLFQTEAADHVRTLSEQLLKLERTPSDPKPVREMFLAAHTIKGGAAMLDLDTVRTLAHAMEDALARLRDERRPLDPPLADALFQAIDRLGELVASCDSALASSEHVAPLVARLEAASADVPDETLSNAPTAELPTPSPAVVLVDASATVRMLGTLELNEAGYQVAAVADGAEALGLIEQDGCALLVAGTDRQGVRGIDLAAQARATANGQALPIVVVTSEESPSEKQRAQELGVGAYVQRGSLRQRHLAETIQTLLGGTAA